MASVHKETHVVSAMTNNYKETCTVVRDEKDDRLLPHQIRRPRLTKGGEKSFKKSGNREESSSDKRSEIPCRYNSWQKPSCKFWHPPVCQNYKSETRCKFGRTCFFRHVESKKGGAKRSVVSLKESTQPGCVSQDSEGGKLGSRHARIKIRERRCPSRGIIQKCEPHERSPCAPKFGERSHEDTLHQETCARKAAWDLANILTSSRIRTKLRFTLLPKRGQCLHPLRKVQRNKNSWSTQEHQCTCCAKKELSSDELETLRRSTNPTTVLTANGEVHANEEAQENVHDLHQFVPVPLLAETPAVLSLAELCEDHYEWVSGQKPRLTKEEKTNVC